MTFLFILFYLFINFYYLIILYCFDCGCYELFLVDNFLFCFVFVLPTHNNVNAQVSQM